MRGDGGKGGQWDGGSGGEVPRKNMRRVLAVMSCWSVGHAVKGRGAGLEAGMNA